jgi:hypothetical protein
MISADVNRSTPAMVQFPLTTSKTRLRRITYRLDPTLDPQRTAILRCEYTYPEKPSDATEGGESAPAGQGSWQDELDKMLDKAEKEAEMGLEEGVEEVVPAEAGSEALEFGSREAETPAIAQPVESTPDKSALSAEDGGEREDSSAGAPWPDFKAELGRVLEADILMPDR